MVWARSFLGVLAIPITGCAAVAGPARGEATCVADPGQRFVGARADTATASALLKATHTTELRWVPPRTIVTADYKHGRLTVDLDDTNTITRIACG